jgi:zinc protease
MTAQGVEEYALDNGLRVLVKPMHTVPVVSVWIWYRVGSRCERPGVTGVSHWVEHMLFKGTPSLPKGEIMKSISRVGGVDNGFTREDDTVYYETLPAEHLDLGLRIEADRMVNSTFDPAEIESERSVIISEREGAENHPQMQLWEQVMGTAYQVHPYRWPVIGYMCDLRKMTREDLLAHYRRFYAPGNATLVLAGDLAPVSAMEMVRRRFADVPPGGVSHEMRAEEPQQAGERRVEVCRPGNAVYWMCCYHVPAHAHEDRLPLAVLEAVLSGARPLSLSGGGFLGKSARLFDALVNRKKLAVWAGCSAQFMKDPGLFWLSMMLRDGVKPERAESAMFAEISRLQDSGPRPAEMRRALRQVKAQVEYARDGITANAYMVGSFDAQGSLDEMDTIADRVATVTAADVTRVARAYLTRQNRTVGVFMPEGAAGGAAAGAGEDVSAPHGLLRAAWHRSAPLRPAAEGGGATALTLPTVREQTLPCGLRVLGIEDPNSHCVAVAGFIRAGAALDPAGREATAYLTAEMLDQGTLRKSCRQIASRMDRIGAGIYFGAGPDSTDFGGKCLPADLPKVLALLQECLSEAAAPQAELEKVRRQSLTAMKADRDSTAWLATRAALEGLYPAGHPYCGDVRGTAETLSAISRDELLDFAGRCYGPQNTTLIVVGPLAFERACGAVERAFGKWRPLATVPSHEPRPVLSASAPGERIIEAPGKSQCDLVVARIAVPRSHPDYHGLAVASTIFGRFGLMGRIGERVRDQMGLAYYAFASIEARLQAGHWAVRAGVNPANVRKALDAIRAETDRFCSEPVSEQELSDTVGHLVGSLALRMETSDSLARLVKDIAFHNLPLDYLERYQAEVRGVTRERVLELARKYLAGREPVVTIAGPPLPGEA